MQVTAQTITLNALQWVRFRASRMNRIQAHCPPDTNNQRPFDYGRGFGSLRV